MTENNVHDRTAAATLRVAMCQVHSEPWAVEANFQRTLEALETAARAGAELAITPECVLHGYANLERPQDHARLLEVAQLLDGPLLLHVRELARARGMNIVIGFAERGEAGRVYNAAAHIDADGSVLDVYRKVHLRPFESIEHRGGFTPGDRFAVVPLARRGTEFRIGTIICFDREVPESLRCVRSQGAQFVACPLATDTFDMQNPANRADNEMITRVRAAENELYIAVVNHSGRCNGGSFIVGPLGELLHQMGPDAGVSVHDISVGRIRDHFHARPLGWMGWGHRRQAVYDRNLR